VTTLQITAKIFGGRRTAVRLERRKTVVRPALATLALALLAACGGSGRGTAPDTSGIGQPPATTSFPSPGASAAVAAAARPIAGTEQDYADLLTAAQNARRIMLGESTHGTHQHYRERARISERLIADQNAQAITIEGEWSAAWRVNLYVRGMSGDTSADAALAGFTDFPRWMWPNSAFRDFVERVRAINLTRPPEQRVGIYGMDVYDLFDAADFVVAELQRTEPAAAERARAQYRCFASFNRSTTEYGEAARRPARSCQEEAEAVVAEVRRIPRPAGAEPAERHFGLQRSAASVAAAEEYFREAYAGTQSWNLRDRRMADTVDAVAAHGEALTGRPGKVVAWAHNSHMGDARATSMAARGELNLGQVMRERHGDAALLVGFFAATGTVMAAEEWDTAGRGYTLRPPIAGSHEALFQQTGLAAFSLMLRGNASVSNALAAAMPQRAVGVIYRPDTEIQSHYFNARLPDQFDAAVFFAASEAVTPLRR
jgi:erythromycin esterase-like protein